jgi:hypothetical protein
MDRLRSARGSCGGTASARLRPSETREAHLVHLVNAALGIDVEAADALDLVVEKIDAIGNGAPHREKIDQPAAKAVLAGRDHLCDMAVSGERELAAKLRALELLALSEEERVSGEVLNGRQPVERRRHRHDRDVELTVHHLVERGEPLRDEIAVRREMIVRQRFPIGKEMHLQRRVEERNFFEQALRVRGAFGDDEHGASARRETGNSERVARSVQGGRVPALAGRGNGKLQHRKCRKNRRL